MAQDHSSHFAAPMPTASPVDVKQPRQDPLEAGHHHDQAGSTATRTEDPRSIRMLGEDGNGTQPIGRKGGDGTRDVGAAAGWTHGAGGNRNSRWSDELAGKKYEEPASTNRASLAPPADGLARRNSSEKQRRSKEGRRSIEADRQFQQQQRDTDRDRVQRDRASKGYYTQEINQKSSADAYRQPGQQTKSSADSYYQAGGAAGANSMADNQRSAGAGGAASPKRTDVPRAPGRETSLRNARASEDRKGKRSSTLEDSSTDSGPRGDATIVLFLLPLAELKTHHGGRDGMDSKAWAKADKEKAKHDAKREKMTKWMVYSLPLKQADAGGVLGKGKDAAAGAALKAKGLVMSGSSTVQALKRLPTDERLLSRAVIFRPSQGSQEGHDSNELILSHLFTPSLRKKYPAGQVLLSSSVIERSKTLPPSLHALSLRPAMFAWSLEPTHDVFAKPDGYTLPSLERSPAQSNGQDVASSGEGDQTRSPRRRSHPLPESAGATASSLPVSFRSLAREIISLVKREIGDKQERERWELADEKYVAEDLEECLKLGGKETVKQAK